MVRFIFLLTLISVTCDIGFAADEVLAGSQFDDHAEIEIAQKVKNKDYLGGVDEGELKVQVEILNPSRKLAPQAEIKNEEPAEE